MKLVIMCLAVGTLPWPGLAQEKVNPGSLVLQDFAQRAAAYMKVHRAAAAHIHGLKPTKTAAEIERHEQALAHEIREARKGATQGNIFTPEIAAQFHVLIGETMKGPSAGRIRESLKQAEPVWLSRLKVNMIYPEAVPLQSSPPTLLMNLPELPAQLEYRFVGRTLILRDLEANLIVDFLRNAIPEPLRRLLLLGILGGWAAGYAADLKLPNAEKSVRFAVIGDSGSGLKPEFDVGRLMAEYRATFAFEFVVMLGDNIYGGNSPADYKRKFEDPYAQLLSAGVKFFAALGNHDSTSARFYKPFNMEGKRYYNYKRDEVEFFALDSNYMDPEQLKWLREQLTRSNAKWKICYFHHPLYSDGKKHGPDLDLRRLLEPLFIETGVSVVLTGHEHFYERIKPKNGIQYFVLGNSGELRPGNLRRSADVEKGFDTDQAFALMEISGDELHFQAIARGGQTVDNGVFTLPKKK